VDEVIWKLDELAELLGVPRRQIVDAEKYTKNGVLSWTEIHGGYCAHELMLPELRKALAEMPATKAAKRSRMPRTLLRFRV
jgi:hypothetical protein